jgi:hypothetical protein
MDGFPFVANLWRFDCLFKNLRLGSLHGDVYGIMGNPFAWCVEAPEPQVFEKAIEPPKISNEGKTIHVLKIHNTVLHTQIQHRWLDGRSWTRWMDGGMEGWMDGWMHGWMDGCMDGSVCRWMDRW